MDAGVFIDDIPDNERLERPPFPLIQLFFAGDDAVNANPHSGWLRPWKPRNLSDSTIEIAELLTLCIGPSFQVIALNLVDTERAPVRLKNRPKLVSQPFDLNGKLEIVFGTEASEMAQQRHNDVRCLEKAIGVDRK